MKKFKKSTVIVPALARIAVTTAASVSGTVAWFTASRTATATAGQFTIGTNEGDLKVTLSNGVGVTNNTDTPESTVDIAVQKTGEQLNTLLDASYDGAKFYTDTNGGAALYKEVSQRYSANSKYFYAFSWSLTFSIDITNVTSNYDIFFNVKDSSVGKNTSVTGSALRVSRGEGTNRITWAPKATSADVNTHTDASEGGYVNSTNTSTNYTVASLSAHGLIASDQEDLKTLATNGSSNTTRGDYLGTCTKNDETHTATLAVKFVVWYEGLDKNIKNDNLNDLASLTTNLSFYARENA